MHGRFNTSERLNSAKAEATAGDNPSRQARKGHRRTEHSTLPLAATSRHVPIDICVRCRLPPIPKRRVGRLQIRDAETSGRTNSLDKDKPGRLSFDGGQPTRFSHSDASQAKVGRNVSGEIAAPANASIELNAESAGVSACGFGRAVASAALSSAPAERTSSC